MALLIIGGLLINSSCTTYEGKDQVYAIENGANRDNDTGSSLKLTLPDNIQAQKAIEANKVGYISNNFTIEASNISKYYIAVQAAPGYDSNLVGLVNKETVGGVGTNKLPADFAKNTWGYNLTDVTDNVIVDESNLIYSTVPDSTNVASAEYNVDTTGDVSATYRLTFAAKLGEDKPADHYQSQVLLSVAIEPVEVIEISFGGVTTMQDLTPDICKKIDITNGEVEGLLKDSRDDKVYWVAKLRDGNCWMTQNLDFDLMKGMTLKPEDSDVKSEREVTGITSIDKGEYYYTAPTNNEHPCSGATKLFNCVGWAPTKISSSWIRTYDPSFIAAANYLSADGKMQCIKVAGSYFGDMESDYIPCRMYNFSSSYTIEDSHYVIGNYYSWYSAMAGSMNGAGADATSSESICPKGWGIPKESNTTNWESLLSAYNIPQNGSGSLQGTVDGKEYDLRLKPLYFLYGGTSSTSDVGSAGAYWSGQTWASNNLSLARTINFAQAASPSQNFQSRGTGVTVRCVLKKS